MEQASTQSKKLSKQSKGCAAKVARHSAFTAGATFGNEDDMTDDKPGESKAQIVRDAYGFLKQAEFEALQALADGSHTVINIGAGVGTSGLLFREVCGQDANIVTVDICEGSPTGGLQNEREAFARPGYDWKLPTQILGDSAKVGREWTGGLVDFVFVDGDHSEAQCRADIQAWLPHIKPGGIMAFHDYVDYPFKGVINAVDDLMAGQEEIVKVACMIAFRCNL
jgi:predicted O-methyltransferase YrrM